MASFRLASVIATQPGSTTFSIRVTTLGASPIIDSPSPVSRSPTIAGPLWIAAQGVNPTPRVRRSRSLISATLSRIVRPASIARRAASSWAVG